MKVLISGFKPFLSEPINPTEEIVNWFRTRADLSVKNFEVGTSSRFKFKSELELCLLVLPVEFGKCFELLESEVRAFNPEYIIMLGQAGGRSQIQFEKVGLNWVQTENADEAGEKPIAGSLVPSAELALMSKFPIDEICGKLKSKYPVSVSFSAGAFVCNDLFFRTLKAFPNKKSVFIHFPFLPEQALGKNHGQPSLPLEKQIGFIEDLLPLLI